MHESKAEDLAKSLDPNRMTEIDRRNVGFLASDCHMPSRLVLAHRLRYRVTFATTMPWNCKKPLVPRRLVSVQQPLLFALCASKHACLPLVYVDQVFGNPAALAETGKRRKVEPSTCKR